MEASDRVQLDGSLPSDASSQRAADAIEEGDRGRFDASLSLDFSSRRATTDPESLDRQPLCREMLDDRPSPKPAHVPPACLLIFIEVAEHGGPRSADAVTLLRSFCNQVFEFMGSDCSWKRSAVCEESLTQIASAGPVCEDIRVRAAELVQMARAIDLRLGAALSEADRLIELRRAKCEVQNRGSACKDYKWQRKEWSSPPRPGWGPNPNSVPRDEPLEACPVTPRSQCPSTRAADPETRRLVSAFEVNLPRIDDRPRNRFVCRAWQDASTFCDRASVAPPRGSVAGAFLDLPDATK